MTGCGVPVAVTQALLFDIPEFIPDLSSYDLIGVSISGGKDSQIALREVVRLCREQGVPLSRVVCVFADLGKDSEWPGTQEIAAYHAAQYGLRFITVQKQTRNAGGGTRPQGLLERVVHRGHWPSPEQRWCTSDFKRGPIGTVITRLINEIRAQWRERIEELTGQPWSSARMRLRRVRVLSVVGIRAEESPKRRKMQSFTRDSHTNNGRITDEWLPVHRWTLQQIWNDILTSGIRFHYAYYLVGRLSCPACIFAPRAALVAAARANLGMFARHVAAEQVMAAEKILFTITVVSVAGQSGYVPWRVLRKIWRTHGRFRMDDSMAEVFLEATAAGPVDPSAFSGPPLQAAGWEA